MPSCHFKKGIMKRVNGNSITLPIATLHAMLPYAPQFLYHSTTHDSIVDDGNFRFFAFEPSIALNYVEEEMQNRNTQHKFMHVFKIKKHVPYLALFADSEKAMSNMGGHETILRKNLCPPSLTPLSDAESRHARELGMPPPEYHWAKNINKMKVVIDDSEHYLNGWIRTTAISTTTQYRLLDPGLELMLNVDNLHEYLEQVHCWPLVDYKPTVIQSK